MVFPGSMGGSDWGSVALDRNSGFVDGEGCASDRDRQPRRASGHRWRTGFHRCHEGPPLSSLRRRQRKVALLIGESPGFGACDSELVCTLFLALWILPAGLVPLEKEASVEKRGGGLQAAVYRAKGSRDEEYFGLETEPTWSFGLAPGPAALDRTGKKRHFPPWQEHPCP